MPSSTRSPDVRRSLGSGGKRPETTPRLPTGSWRGSPTRSPGLQSSPAWSWPAFIWRSRTRPARAEEILVHRPKLGVLGERVAELRHGLAPRPAGEGLASALTPAELRLLPLLASYLSFREIAERLGVSRNTVKTQAIAIYRKLNVSSRSEAVEHARETGLLKDIAPLP